ncbi:hypothetical protein AB1Y20_005228 [Prymnesium parvum]|uniref:WDR90 4th beta-propeller domain-containing protein n=1 Tax=Prymnesium parvum TaxID=97485 RepID=A0AB34J2R8_PRYPA
MPEDDAMCSALSTDESETLCVMGHSSGELRLVEVSSLEVVAGVQAHHASVCCVSFCYFRRGERCIISAASDGEVRLFELSGGTAESEHQMQLTRLATLRAATGVRVHSLDVLRSLSTGSCSHWLASSEHQQVQVWPLPDAALTPADPILTIELEPEPLLVVAHELAAIGWRCLAAFCPHHHQVIACCGLTRERRLLFYDFVQRQPLMAVPLPEWPTSLAFSRCAPLLAIAGARGRVMLISYPQFGAFYPFLGVAKLDVVNISLHTRTVNSVYFGGSVLHTATDREIAEWQLPST